MVKISVIITSHNYGRYIETAINSVLNQTFDDYEIIIVDDVSIDNTRDILKKYENNEKNKDRNPLVGRNL